MHVDYYGIVSITDFIYFLVDFGIDSTAKFVQFKKEVGLPDDIPDKPLRVYAGLKKDWSKLWRRVNKIRFDNQVKEEILALVKENSHITISEINRETDFKRKVVERIMNQLKKEGRLARIGSDRSGYWEILEEGAKPSPDPMEKQKEQVLALIAENRYITVLAMSKKIKLSIDVIGYTINRLKEEGRLVRIGSDRSGYWEILEEGAKPSPDPMEARKKQILTFMVENRRITIREIFNETNYTRAEIKYAIGRLKKEGRLARIGYGENKYWEVLEEGAKPSPDPMEERKKQILTLMVENQRITAREIADKMELSRGTIVYTINRLKKEGRLVRIGSSESRHWKVLETNITN